MPEPTHSPADAGQAPNRDAHQNLIDEARRRAIALLLCNLAPEGILAATPGERAAERGYTAIFGRDAAVCALGMATCGEPLLERHAATGLVTLAKYQAGNGQMPKFVDVGRNEADFWYLGCIDSTLWWLIAIDSLDRVQPASALRSRFSREMARAIAWLEAQEHQRFFLLQQNEASDWADIMPRSGFVLYTNALWYHVKRAFGLPRQQQTLDNANHLFHPFSSALAEYRRARLLADYALEQARNRDLYLSFVNFSFFGDEGDVFGNLLAVLLGLAGHGADARTLDALARAGASDPYPVRTVCNPILEESFLWRPYMSRHRQNYAWQYHNGGIWPFVGGFWVAALVQCGRHAQAREELLKLARANALDDWAFNEWLHGLTLQPSGMPGQSWNAAAFLFAERAVRLGEPLLRIDPPAVAL
jgi:glycogen debranching enzyme